MLFNIYILFLDIEIKLYIYKLRKINEKYLIVLII